MFMIALPMTWPTNLLFTNVVLLQRTGCVILLLIGSPTLYEDRIYFTL